MPSKDTTQILVENNPQPLQEAVAFLFFSPRNHSYKKNLEIEVVNVCK